MLQRPARIPWKSARRWNGERRRGLWVASLFTSRSRCEETQRGLWPLKSGRPWGPLEAGLEVWSLGLGSVTALSTPKCLWDAHVTSRGAQDFTPWKWEGMDSRGRTREKQEEAEGRRKHWMEGRKTRGRWAEKRGEHPGPKSCFKVTESEPAPERKGPCRTELKQETEISVENKKGRCAWI